MSFPYASRPAKRLRPKTPKSPWSRRILFPAPSGHFRIVPFLIGFFVWSLGLLIDSRFFFVLCSASVSYGFVLWLLGAFCVPSGFDGWLFRFRPRFLRSGSSFASFRLDGALKGFFVCSPLGVVFRFSSFLLALRSLRQVVRSSFSVFSDGSCLSSVFLSPSSRFSSSLFPFLLSDGLRFLLDSLQGSSLFCPRSLFSSFRSRLRLFPFSLFLIRPALPFISFVVFGFLSASLHRDAPSGGGVGRAAWPRPTPSASVRPSRRIGRAWSRCRCVACRRRPCPGPGPA